VSTERGDAPSNLRSLETRISNVAREQGRPVRRVQRAVANTVIGQMLPPGVVKGGTAIKLRVRENASRFTLDFDAARDANVELGEYLDQLADTLAAGWNGSTGTVEELEPAQPEGIPEEYVMQPFLNRLAYRGRHWLSVTFELGRDEIGSTENHDARIASDLVDLFEKVALPVPSPVPLLALDHQIAQKLHACTSQGRITGGNDRAHDLVDLQILLQDETVDRIAVGVTGRRLFAARRSHAWPPVVVEYPSWATIYAEAADGLDVLANVVDAVVWANEFIESTGEP
jgi:Nucleotidyl transferase AbiEii toxin, Type IV TA system